jgi:hypothetical protein
LSINVEITETQIVVTAENGTRVALSKRTGVIANPADAPLRLRNPKVKAESLKISPRWIAKVGDAVMAQHKKGGRKFRTTIRAFKVENGSTYVQVADPRNGGTYLLGLDRITRASNYRVGA